MPLVICKATRRGSGVIVQVSPVSAFAFDPFWQNVALLLHGENSTIYDETGKTPTVTAVTLSTTNRKFGSSSMFFNGSTSLMTVPGAVTNGQDFLPTPNDFTAEAYIYPTSSTGSQTIFHFNSGGAGGVHFWKNSSNQLVLDDGLTGQTAFTTTVTLNAWHHVAWVRSGTTNTVYLDGVSIGTNTATPAAGITTLNIGKMATQAFFFAGYMDEIRVTKGIARYTSNFALPTYQTTYTPATDDQYWAQDVLLLHGDGTNNSTSVVDEMAHFLTLGNGAKISTAQSKFGGSSLIFAGTNTTTAGDYIDTPASPDFTFGTGDFTIEMWIRFATLPTSGGYAQFFDGRPAQTNGAYITIDLDFSLGNKFVFVEAGLNRITSATTPTTNTWYHLALCRSSGSTRLFINGTQEGSTFTDTTSYLDTQFRMGASKFHISPIGQYGLNGFLDEIRISRVARYTANFTPATTAFAYVSKSALCFNDYQASGWDYDYDSSALLLSCNGANGATTMTDPHGHTPTFVGNAAISTTQSKFGGASLFIDAYGTTTNYVSLANSGDWIFAGDFTVEFWIYPTNIGPGTAGSTSVMLMYTNNWTFYVNGQSPSNFTFNMPGVNAISASASLTMNAWQHLAIVRNGNLYSVYKNGVSVGSVTNAGPPAANSTALYIGSSAGLSAHTGISAYFDDIRITNSKARYATTFTTPVIELSPNQNSAIDPYWNQTVALLSGDGPSNGNLIRDVKGHTVTRVSDTANLLRLEAGNLPFTSAITVINKQIIGGSDGGSVRLDASSDWNFGSGDFTYELWAKISGTGNAVPLANFGALGVSGTNPTWSFQASSTAILFYSSVSAVKINASQANFDNVWRHYALVRSGNTVTIFVNGINKGAYTYSTNQLLGDSTTPIHMIYDPVNIGGTNNGLQVWLDDVRITKGVARYLHAFSPVKYRAPDFNTFDTNYDNVVLHLPMDGTNGSTTIADTKGHTMTVTAGVSISNAQSKFGGSSALINGTTTQYLSAASTAADWKFGTNNFTIEFWLYATASGPADSMIISNSGAGDDRGWKLFRNSLNSNFIEFKTWFPTNSLATNTALALNAWHHYAICRSGSVFTVFIDGVSVGSSSFAGADLGSGTDIYIGGHPLRSGITGYFDDVKITKGVAKYTGTGSFPVPVLANPATYSPQQRYMMLSAVTARSQIQTTTLLAALGQGSVEFWVNVNQVPATGGGIYQDVYSEEISTGAALAAMITTGLKPAFYVHTPTDINIVANRALTVGEWHHVVITWNTSNLVSFYIDGVLDYSTTIASTVASGTITAVGIGNSVNGPEGSIIGGLRGFRLYNTAITQATVTTRYNNGVSPVLTDTQASNLVAAYHFNSGTTLERDYSNNGRDLTIGSGCVMSNI